MRRPLSRRPFPRRPLTPWRAALGVGAILVLAIGAGNRIARARNVRAVETAARALRTGQPRAEAEAALTRVGLPLEYADTDHGTRSREDRSLGRVAVRGGLAILPTPGAQTIRLRVRFASERVAGWSVETSEAWY